MIKSEMGMIRMGELNGKEVELRFRAIDGSNTKVRA
jgi:hypothetical protein